MFGGFQLDRVDVGDVTLRVRYGGSGEPLVLLDGHPRTHTTWHRVAPQLANSFFAVCPDLRGYGQSTLPPDAAGAARLRIRNVHVPATGPTGCRVAGPFSGRRPGRDPHPEYRCPAAADVTVRARIRARTVLPVVDLRRRRPGSKVAISGYRLRGRGGAQGEPS